MKKILLVTVVVLVCLSMVLAFSLTGCKEEEPTDTTAAVADFTAAVADTTAAVADTTAAEIKGLTKVIWISPRGSIDVMDDVCYWVAKEMGYFEELGIELVMEPGPMEAFSCTKFVAERQADVGFPSPGVLTSSVDTGMEVIGVYNRMPKQIFDFAKRKDSDIETLQDIAGKSISLGSAGWQVIVDPILVSIGVDPESVEYVIAGEQWGQAVALGEADVALVWEGYRAQWDALGLGLDYFIGIEDFPDNPSNCEAIRKSDLNDPERKALWINFFKAVSMGQHFLRHNPRGGTQIAYNMLPVVREQMGPKEALDFTQQLHWICTYGERELGGYGDMDMAAWEEYLQIIYDLGQTSKLLVVDEVITNELIAEINDFDRAKVEQDAKAFVLEDTWKSVEVTGNW